MENGREKPEFIGLMMGSTLPRNELSVFVKDGKVMFDPFCTFDAGGKRKMEE